MRFLSWKYSHYFEFVYNVLSSFKNMSSNLKKHLELQHSTVKFTEQVPPGGVKQRAAIKAQASTSAPKQQKQDLSAKQVSGGELK